MINKTPPDLDKFPVPVSGQEIPRGWFARLVSFVNSLVLHGDNQYLAVKHTLAGQTIAPTSALLQALGQRGAPPAAGGGTSYIAGAGINITGGTISCTVTQGMPPPTSDTSRQHAIRLDESYVMQHDGWARMSAVIESLGTSANMGFAYMRVVRSGLTVDHLVTVCGFVDMEGNAGGSLMVPVLSGSTVSAHLDLDAGYSVHLASAFNEILIYD